MLSQRNTRARVGEEHVVAARIEFIIGQLARAGLDAARTLRAEVEVRVVEVKGDVVVVED